MYVLNSTTFSPGGGPTYTNGRLPNVQGQGNEVGLKTALFDGRISSQFAVYHAALSNQQITIHQSQPERGREWLVVIKFDREIVPGFPPS